jgi:hypothetical protein
MMTMMCQSRVQEFACVSVMCNARDIPDKQCLREPGHCAVVGACGAMASGPHLSVSKHLVSGQQPQLTMSVSKQLPRSYAGTTHYTESLNPPAVLHSLNVQATASR